MRCSCGFEVQHGEIEYDVRIPCPVCGSEIFLAGGRGEYKYVPKETRRDDSEWLALVHSLWEELHRFAIVATEEQWAKARQWYEAWLKRVPAFGCDCQKHFEEMAAIATPRFESREAFFEWTVARHNEVNSRLGKSLVSVETALTIYGPAPW